MKRLYSMCVLSLAMVVLSGCRGDSEPTNSSSPAMDNPGDEMVYPDAMMRPVAPTCKAPARQPPSGPVTLEEAFADRMTSEVRDGLLDVVEDPHEPGSWFAVRKAGFVHHLGDDGTTQALDISERLFIDQETGLVNLAFDPTQDDVVYAIYMVPPGSGANAKKFTNVVARFSYNRQIHTIDPDSTEVLLELPDPNGSHNVNDLLFDEEGMLYISIGDGGNPYDYLKNGQRSDTWFGTVLRIDPSTSQGERPYGIPEDNPFMDEQGQPTEVWAYGLRNPWRMTLDRETGQIWVGDVGQDTWEEVNLLERGANYGWPHMEGPACYQKEDCNPEDYTVPYWSYTHAEGGSITMGPVIRDSALPTEMQGQPLVGDFVNGNVWTLYSDSNQDEQNEQDEQKILSTLLLESTHNISSWAVGHDNSIYIVKYGAQGDGAVFKVTKQEINSIENEFPKTLSATGCFSEEDPRQPLEGVFPYAPVATLWSDGAEKKRWLVVPANRRVEVLEDGDMLFPVGSMLFKEFAFDDVPHETRMLVHHEDGWTGYSYRWREDGSDADLLDSQEIVDLNNGIRWVYPSRSQCMECHTAAANRVLGPEYLQLDHIYEPLDSSHVQHDVLDEKEFFNEVAQETLEEVTQSVDASVDPFDESEDVTLRARSYLHANCSYCHRPDSTSTQANIDLRYTTAFKDMGLCNKESEHGNLYRSDGSELRLLKPGEPEKSILYLRMESLDLFRMPPVGTGVVHEQGLKLMSDWIQSVESCP